MTTWDDKTAERFAELARLARGRANTLGDDVDIISEPFRRVNNVILEETWQQIPSTDGGLTPPKHDGYGEIGDVGTRFEAERLHSYLASGTTGPDSIQTFFVVSSTPASHGIDDIDAVRVENLISPVFSPNKANAADPDPDVRGFELVLYPAKSTPGGGPGDMLVVDDARPIPITADPSGGLPVEMAPGLGSDAFWDVNYMSGIVRLSAPPLNGSGGVFNPHNVYGDIDGVETDDGYGVVTLFATYYQYTGAFGQLDESNLVVIGDGYISHGAFEGISHNTFQNALDSLPAGGAVLVKEGDYIFTSPVEVPSDKSIVGLSKRVSIMAPADAAAFDINGSNIGIEGLTIRTLGSAGGSCIRLVGGDAYGSLGNIKIVDNNLYCRHDAYGVEFSPEAESVRYNNIDIRNNVFRNEYNSDGYWSIVGATGEIQVSYDGVQWIHRAADGAYTGEFRDVAHDGIGLFCAVGQSGEVQISSDGETWTSTIALGPRMYGIAHNGVDLWCTVGTSGAIATSPDGITWTTRTQDASYSSNFRRVAYDSVGLWVAVGQTGEIQTSPDGITWTRRTQDAAFSGHFFGIAHDGVGLWCAVGADEIQTSPDGITWTHRDHATPFVSNFNNVAHDGVGLWCAVGSAGEIQTSPDGINWDRQAVASYDSSFQDIAHDGFGLWCAVGNGGGIQTSPDGKVWTDQTADAPYSGDFKGVAFAHSSPIYIGERNSNNRYDISDMSIVENQFANSSMRPGDILLELPEASMRKLLISQNTGDPNLSLLALYETNTETVITNNSLWGISCGNLQNLLFSDNIVKTDVAFSTVSDSVISDNYIGRALSAASISGTNLIGNRVIQNNLDISPGCHIWDGYISADGPNVYINDNLLPKVTGQELGSRNNRWDGYFTRLDIGDATTVITDGYISSNRKLEISAGNDDIELHSRVIQRGPNNNLVELYNGEIKLGLASYPNVTISDGYISANKVLGISAGLNNIELHSKVIQRGPNDSSVILDNGDIRLGEVNVKNFLLALGPSTWTQRTEDGTAQTLNGIAYDGGDILNGVWCLVGGVDGPGDEAEVQTSSDGGLTWTQQTPNLHSAGEGLFGVIYGDGYGEWVAVGGLGQIQTSPDGVTWTTRPPANLFTGTIYDIDYDGDGYWSLCAVGSGGEIQTSATGGWTWAHQTADASFSGVFRGIAHDGVELWCIVGAAGEIQTSPDGISWTHRTPDASFSDDFWAVAHNGSDLWCVVGGNGEIQTSPNGIDWTQQTPDASYSGTFRGIAHDGVGLWCTVGISGEAQTSPDGVIWTRRILPAAPSNIFAIANDGLGMWCATGVGVKIQTSLRIPLPK